MSIEEAQKRRIELKNELEELREYLSCAYTDTIGSWKLEILEDGTVRITTVNKLGGTEKHVNISPIAFLQFMEFYNSLMKIKMKKKNAD